MQVLGNGHFSINNDYRGKHIEFRTKEDSRVNVLAFLSGKDDYQQHCGKAPFLEIKCADEPRSFKVILRCFQKCGEVSELGEFRPTKNADMKYICKIIDKSTAPKNDDSLIIVLGKIGEIINKSTAPKNDDSLIIMLGET